MTTLCNCDEALIDMPLRPRVLQLALLRAPTGTKALFVFTEPSSLTCAKHSHLRLFPCTELLDLSLQREDRWISTPVDKGLLIVLHRLLYCQAAEWLLIAVVK